MACRPLAAVQNNGRGAGSGCGSLLARGRYPAVVVRARGVALLATYSLGLGIPFILAAVASRPFLAFLQRFKRHLALMERIMGVLLVITGIAILNVFPWFSMNAFGQWMLDTFPALLRIEEWFTSPELQREILRTNQG